MTRALPLPSLPATLALAAAATVSGLARWAGVDAQPVALVTGGLAAAGGLALLLDAALSWRALRRHPITLQRRLPHALAIGQPHAIGLSLSHEGPDRWQVELFDHVPDTFQCAALPLRLHLPAAGALDTRYEVTPTRRGPAGFAPGSLRVRSRWGLMQWQLRCGAAQTLPVYPNFTAVARYAWLAGDRRLAEIGIKTWRERGSGTDFKQLAEYAPGASTRHIDWNASMRHRRAVVREYQDDRDQSVLFLLDCGRRMRADERAAGAPGDPADPVNGVATGHFDQALDALMLMAWVALKEGDAVGAMSFGHAPGQARHQAPRKGLSTLNTLVARLHDLEPSTTHSDYVEAARELMRQQPRRALVVLLTNFREESSEELAAALRLLRTRHLVLLASLKERVVGELAEGPLDDPAQVRDAAAAHLFEQARRDAFNRLGQQALLQVDVEPQGLATALVNRYHAVKAAGLL